MRAPEVSGVLVLGGPTASGKTSLAITLAERFGGEIVGADARQIYRAMPIGTAAPTTEQLARVPHHLIGFVDPYQRYSAARFVTDAAAAIAAIRARGKRAIVVGGTGFYLRALCGDVALSAAPDPALRARIAREAQAHPLDVLHDWLRSRNSARAAPIAAADRYRIVRALEIELGRAAGSRSLPPREPLPTLRAAGIPFVKLALHADIGVLAERIAQRTDAMLAAGFIAEAERIGLDAVASDAVGYREALAYQSGWFNLTELQRALVRNTRRYAKRQLTWLRGEPGVTWVDATDLEHIDAAVAVIGWTASPR